MVVAYGTVDEFLAAQTVERRALVNAVRSVVADAQPDAVEHIKWNSPSWVVDGIDQATISAQGKAGVRLVLHRGASRPENAGADAGAASVFAGDPLGMLTWHSDIRASLLVTDLADLAGRRDAAVELVRSWLAAP
ncbi:hypothetical protein IWX81_001476 [Salinibacterium sp. CAN_S4]|uniref:DUF1801 domain-containing protein n=1 Tax=Salinibacterium sp. CAN_S4 TaxID=2787727 RepID=UPI0018F016BA